MSWINNNKFDKQTNIGFPATFQATDKFPLIDKRIFSTKEAVESFISNPTSSAIPGLILRVTEDTEAANNGAYLVEKDGETQLKLTKIATGDISTFLKSSQISSNVPSDDSTLIILSTSDNNGSIFNSSIKIAGNNYVKITGSSDNIIISASTATLVDASNGSTGLALVQDIYQNIVTVEKVTATAIATMAETLGMDSSLSVEWSEESGIPEGTDYKTAIEQYSGKTYTAGDNINISEENVISASINTYTAGDNISISEENVISASINTYTAGDNINISEENVISASINLATTQDILSLFIDPRGLTLFRYSDGTSSTSNDSTITASSYTIPEGCELVSVKFGSNVESISSNAFENCAFLTSVTIPNNITTISSNAFKNCGNLTSVSIDSNSIISKNYTYLNNLKNLFGSQVTEYIIGDSVTNIGQCAFEDCTSLTSITLGNNVASIGGYAFRDCSGLTSITIPNSVTSIGERAFFGCNGLTSVTIGNSVTSIGSWAFANCGSLASVTIGNSVTSIDEDAFAGCSSLTSVTIPASTTNIEEDAFAIGTAETTRNITLKSLIPINLENGEEYILAFGKFDTAYTLGINLYVPAAAFDTYYNSTDAGWEYYRNCLKSY